MKLGPDIQSTLTDTAHQPNLSYI